MAGILPGNASYPGKVHVPAGMSQASTGQQGGPAGVTMQEVGYTARSVPAGIYAAQLVLTVTPTRPGGSLARWSPRLTGCSASPRSHSRRSRPASRDILA